jgi:tripartite-type tricarboxylate transporter receptor subunit TctC
MKRRQLLGAGLTACTLPVTFPVAAQAPYPNQPIRVIVPQPPGGGFDQVARQLADRMAPLLGQPMVVENKPGSGTVLGTDAAAKATADGYTLLLGALSNMALNPGLYARLPYDSARDFKPVGLAVSYAYTLIARKDLPFRTLQELIRFARDNPEKLTYASAGNGSGQHVAAAVLFQSAKARLQHVPYRGSQPAYQDVIGGRVDLMFDILPTAKLQIDAGTVRPLAVSSAARQPLLPEVPTVQETGLATLDMESWFGLFVQAAVRPAVVARLRSDFAKAVAQADLAGRFNAQGGRALQLTAEQTEAFLKAELAKWPRLVRETGITLD